MKNLLLTAAVIILFATAALAQSKAPGEGYRVTSFLGIKLGQPLSASVPKCQSTSPTERCWMVRVTESGPVVIDIINGNPLGGRYMLVDIDTSGRVMNVEATFPTSMAGMVLAAMNQRYGPQDGPSSSCTFWSRGETTIYFDRHMHCASGESDEEGMVQATTPAWEAATHTDIDRMASQF